MGGEVRDVIPSSLPPNGLYDPVWRMETDGRDRTLPVLCTYCGAALGVRKEFGGTYDVEAETHDCMGRVEGSI